MTDALNRQVPRRAFVRAAGLAVPMLGTALVVPRASAQPEPEPQPGDEACDASNGQPGGCPVSLPEEFSSASFSTTSVVPGTNYSILFSTKIPWGPHVPPGASGYRINSRTITGTKQDGATFSITPSIGEAGARGFGTPSGSSLGFVVDHPWQAHQLVRQFGYTYTVEYLQGLDVMQACTYVTAMTLADNGMVVGGVGSVRFSPPRLTECPGVSGEHDFRR